MEPKGNWSWYCGRTEGGTCVPGLYLLECAVAEFRPLRVLMVLGRKGMATSRWYLRGNKKRKRTDLEDARSQWRGTWPAESHSRYTENMGLLLRDSRYEISIFILPASLVARRKWASNAGDHSDSLISDTAMVWLFYESHYVAQAGDRLSHPMLISCSWFYQMQSTSLLIHHIHS